MDALFTDMQILDWLLISLTSHPWCWSISCCLFLPLQSPHRRPRPRSGSPRASMQHPMPCSLQQPQLSTGGTATPFCPSPLWQGHLQHRTATPFCPSLWQGHLWWHRNKMMCPGRDTSISSEGVTTCTAQSTWGTQRNTSKWTGARESPEHRGKLFLSVCSQVSPEHKELRKTSGLMEANFILQVRINWGKQSKVFFPLPLTELSSQKASPGLSKQSLSHLLRTGNVQSPIWGVLSCNPLQGHLHIKLISEAAQHWTDSVADPREHDSHCNMRVSPVF